MANLNNTPTLGPLDETDLQRSPAPRVPRIPYGCDQQGRYPMAFQPAEACTELGADDDAPGDGSGVLLWPLAVIAIVAIVAFLALVL